MKTCKECGSEKPLSEFYRKARAADGHEAFCKLCRNARSQRNYHKDPEARKRTATAWQEANPHYWAFVQQRNNAKRRGIEFLLTFDEWLAFWGDDLDKRGKGDSRLCMSRNGDAGPYVIGNVFKSTHNQNSTEACATRWGTSGA